MITTSEEYLNNLWKINDPNTPIRAILLPSDEIIYNIDLNTRTIETPASLSVQGDHIAETIYFLVDRMYGNMDLSNTTCVIQYINADNEEGFQVVPFYDIFTFSSQITNEYIKAGGITEDTYLPNKYYIYQTDGEYVLSSDPFEKNQTYYVYNDTSLNKRYIKANVSKENYKSGLYYYFDNINKTYKVANEEFNEDEVYYLNMEKRVIKANVDYHNYKRNTYYILDSNNDLQLATGEFIKDQEYYCIIDKPKILFPCVINAHMAKKAGLIKYSIRFFKCDSNQNVIYNLNTKIAESYILEGMQIPIEDEGFENDLVIHPTKLEEIYELIRQSKQELYWMEA